MAMFPLAFPPPPPLPSLLPPPLSSLPQAAAPRASREQMAIVSHLVMNVLLVRSLLAARLSAACQESVIELSRTCEKDVKGSRLRVEAVPKPEMGLDQPPV